MISTREIARKAGKLHKHVLRDSRKLLNSMEKSVDQFWSLYKVNGREYTEYKLSEEIANELFEKYGFKSNQLTKYHINVYD